MTFPASPSTRRRGGNRPPRRRVDAFAVIIASVLLVGASAMLYPGAASWFSAVFQGQDTERYVETVDSIPPGKRAAELEAAKEYNGSLADGSRIVDPFAAIQDTTVKTSDPYWDLMDPVGDGLMARITIPSLDLDLPIYHGTGNDVLLKGVGHLQGTALPIGGLGTHTVMTGHRGLPQSTLFTHLDKMKVGDSIKVDSYGQTAVYVVTDASVVLPTETESLHPQAGQDLLTLVTCTPVGINSHRILITAERSQDLSARLDAPVNGVGFPWWAPVWLAVLISAVVYVMRTRSLRPAANHRAENLSPHASALNNSP